MVTCLLKLPSLVWLPMPEQIVSIRHGQTGLAKLHLPPLQYSAPRAQCLSSTPCPAL